MSTAQKKDFSGLAAGLLLSLLTIAAIFFIFGGSIKRWIKATRIVNATKQTLDRFANLIPPEERAEIDNAIKRYADAIRDKRLEVTSKESEIRVKEIEEKFAKSFFTLVVDRIFPSKLTFPAISNELKEEAVLTFRRFAYAFDKIDIPKHHPAIILINVAISEPDKPLTPSIAQLQFRKTVSDSVLQLAIKAAKNIEMQPIEEAKQDIQITPKHLQLLPIQLIEQSTLTAEEKTDAIEHLKELAAKGFPLQNVDYKSFYVQVYFWSLMDEEKLPKRKDYEISRNIEQLDEERVRFTLDALKNIADETNIGTDLKPFDFAAIVNEIVDSLELIEIIVDRN